ncbi:hypothetical protein CLU79DRAFT_834418 [Phycomyces nitens]|nr:hypothetical protein CLU79DRAFT_834418 [Phycomyces nitens]
MLKLEHNKLSVQELLRIEEGLLRWSDNRGPRITPELNVLDLSRTDVLGLLLTIFQRLGVLETLHTCHSSLLDFFIDVDAAYVDAPYHSFYHAADVVIMLYYLLTDLGALAYLSTLDTTSLLLATLCHDAGHPGYSNTYQVGFKTDLAIQYQNVSVLESYSIDISRRLLTKHDLLKHVSVPSKQSLVERIERLILSTDMVYHQQLQQQTSWLQSAMTKTTKTTMMNRDDRQGLCRVLLHAADISNTVRPWPIAKQWSDLIVQEFFRQGDAERRAGLPVSPGMDRDLSSQADISLGFGDNIVKPYFEAVARLLPAAHVLVDTLKSNRREWDNLNKSLKCTVCISLESIDRPPSPQSPLSKRPTHPVTPPDDPTFAMRIETWCRHKTQGLQLHLQQQRQR